MRVLITGGGGFPGSHLCDRLIGAGHSVICMDNFLTGRPENIAHLIGHGGKGVAQPEGNANSSARCCSIVRRAPVTDHGLAYASGVRPLLH